MSDHKGKSPVSASPVSKGGGNRGRDRVKKAIVSQDLPVIQVQQELKKLLREHKTLVIVGETGSGKTTQIPQYVEELLRQNNRQRWKQKSAEKEKEKEKEKGTDSSKDRKFPQGLCVAVTQPRRVAAVTIAKRVAAERGVRIGTDVGYSVRFDDCSTPYTRIKYLTDGMLLREAMLDGDLERYGCIMIDEAHERTVHTDILLGLIKHIQKRRPNLRVIIMSATLEAGTFSQYFSNCPILYVSGRQFPVTVWHSKQPASDYLDAALTTILQLHLEKELPETITSKSNTADGSVEVLSTKRPREDSESLSLSLSPQREPADILCFLTGQEEIEAMRELLEDRMKEFPPSVPGILICPLFANLPYHEQLRAFEPAPAGMRKVILATNIAETSLTISGIRYVIDTGLVKQKAFIARDGVGIEFLQVVPISQQMARQRTGRAGRECPGECYRLYPASSYEGLERFTRPEIQRANLSTVVLQMMSMGIDDVLAFEFMEKPKRETLLKAMESLVFLQAIDNSMNLTVIGKWMSAFPLDPSLSRCLLFSLPYGCIEEMLSIVSMMSVENVFYLPTQGEMRQRAEAMRKRFASPYGDHLTLLNIYQAYLKAKRDSTWCHKHFLHTRNLRKVDEIRRQLAEIVERERERLGGEMERERVWERVVVKAEDTLLTKLRKSLLAGLFQHTALRQPGTHRNYCTMVARRTVAVHPSSVLQSVYLRARLTQGTPTPTTPGNNSALKRSGGHLPQCVVYSEFVVSSRAYLRDCTEVDVEWLVEVAPHFYGKVAQASTSSLSLPPSQSLSPSKSPITKKGVEYRPQATMQRDI